MSKEFPISVPINTEDYALFKDIIEQGIDARLEAFVDSNFHHLDGRLLMYFAPCELTTLLRRLLEVGSENAEQWAVDGGQGSGDRRVGLGGGDHH
jgi:hypothetical protein